LLRSSSVVTATTSTGERCLGDSLGSFAGSIALSRAGSWLVDGLGRLLWLSSLWVELWVVA